jgi:superoxide dismutase, Fe-Mn family
VSNPLNGAASGRFRDVRRSQAAIRSLLARNIERLSPESTADESPGGNSMKLPMMAGGDDYVLEDVRANFESGRVERAEKKKGELTMRRRTLLKLAAFSAVTSAAEAAEPAFTLPKLPYAYDALEPYIDAETMRIHHDKHHQAYVDNLNKAIAADPALSKLTVDELLRRLDTLPANLRTAVRNQGGGHANHSLFWQTLCPASKSGKPGGALAGAIAQNFGSQEKFEDQLRAAAARVFGSGWAWLSLDPSGKLILDTASNQDSPLLLKRSPLLGIDVWEHAYYLKYQNRRADYLAAILHVINWDFVSQRYAQMAR